MLRYDRDSLFAAMAATASEAEPEPPADLIAMRDSVAAAQEQWRTAEAAWNEAYSEQRDLSERMQGMNTASDEYFRLFRRFENLEDAVRQLDGEKTRYFDEFTALQSTYAARADSFNAVLASWEDVAFERYVEIVDSLAEAQGEELVDTTDAGGWAYFAVPRGDWWIYTRYPLPFEELYWNILYASGGGVDTLVLNDSNAEVRSTF
jgi:hypothetical protein